MRWKISAVLLHHRPDYPLPLLPRPVRATQLPFSPVRVGEPQVRSLRVVLIGLVFHIRSCIIKERFAQSDKSDKSRLASARCPRRPVICANMRFSLVLPFWSTVRVTVGYCSLSDVTVRPRERVHKCNGRPSQYASHSLHVVLCYMLAYSSSYMQLRPATPGGADDLRGGVD